MRAPGDIYVLDRWRTDFFPAVGGSGWQKGEPLENPAAIVFNLPIIPIWRTPWPQRRLPVRSSSLDAKIVCSFRFFLIYSSVLALLNHLHKENS